MAYYFGDQRFYVTAILLIILLGIFGWLACMAQIFKNLLYSGSWLKGVWSLVVVF